MADLVHALSLAALVAATLEYAMLVRPRGAARRLRFAVEAREALMWGHRFDKPALQRRWVDGRFRLVR